MGVTGLVLAWLRDVEVECFVIDGWCVWAVGSTKPMGGFTREGLHSITKVVGHLENTLGDLRAWSPSLAKVVITT